MGKGTEDAAPVAAADAVLHGAAIIAAVKQSGVRTIVARQPLPVLLAAIQAQAAATTR